MKIKCRKCNIELTAELEELTDMSLLNETDGENLVPAGCFFISDGEYFPGTENKIIINCTDLINSKNHSDIIRLQGCCGLAGVYGINKVCVNGHEIGIEKSDCWIAQGMIFESELIITEE